MHDFSFDIDNFPERGNHARKNAGWVIETMAEKVGRVQHASGRHLGSDNFSL